ncbi:MAG: hypothetical protein JNJ47_04685, partial [Alphaproteobacteria bacterium]|nr:hypothetical protein [Alphaproteobacteria bacterium]
MSIFKKSLLISTALLLGMQEAWSLPLGGQETQEDGQKHPQVSKKEPPKTEELILSPEQVDNLLSYSIPTLFKHKNDFSNKKHPKKISHTQQEPFQNYDCLERQDHIRLHNIFYLLSHKDFLTPGHRYHWLKNLSLQFDALSVYEDMVRHTVDTALGSNKGLAGKLLSFLHHGLEIEALHPEIKRFIVDAITSSKDLEVLGTTLQEIIAFDQTRHKMLDQRKQWLERIEQCKRLPLLPSPEKFEKVSWENLLWKISNSPDLKKIRQEMDNPMLLKEEMETGKRFNRAIGILKTGTFPDIFPELYQSIEEAYESIGENRRIFNDLRKKILGKKYPTLQFYAGFLYEYENLRTIYNVGQSFLPTFDPKNIESRYQLIQCISILSE